MSPAHNPVEMLNYNQLVIDVNGNRSHIASLPPFLLQLEAQVLGDTKVKGRRIIKKKFPKLLLFGIERKTEFYKYSKIARH